MYTITITETKEVETPLREFWGKRGQKYEPIGDGMLTDDMGWINGDGHIKVEEVNG